MSSQEHDELSGNDVVEQAFSRLTAAWDPQQQAVTDDTDREVREQLEAMAMLAYGLEPEAPSQSLKDRLMTSVAASAPAIQASATPVAFPQGNDVRGHEGLRNPVDRTLQHAVATEVQPRPAARAASTIEAGVPLQDTGEQTLRGHGSEAESNVVPFVPRQAVNWLTTALAAALALCLVGLGYFYSQLNQRNATLSVQQERLAEMPRLEQRLDEAQTQLRAMNNKLAMVNTVARQAYPLQPTEAAFKTAALGEEKPFGRVFVCGQHQRWYLTVSGLDPAPSGQSYHLWYMTQQGPVDAGVVEIEGGVAGLESLSMPDDTSGFRLTLEPEGVADAPRGSTILIGEAPVKL